jgi:SAM-dependent methyltransferase
MFPVPQVVWHEMTTVGRASRENEPSEIMDSLEQVQSYVEGYFWGGPMSVVQMYHLQDLSSMIRPGDTILDLACGPGALLLELAAIYPECHFIGADLSPLMLRHLEQEISIRELKNVSILREDIRALPSLRDVRVDLVITTLALHHLPDVASLRAVFQRMKSLLKANGGFYIFDLGLLKSPKTRQVIVDSVANLAPPVMARDYAMSLRAAFPHEVAYSLAKEELSKPFVSSSSVLIDYFYCFKTPSTTSPSPRAEAHINQVWRQLPASMKFEYFMFRLFRTHTTAR